MVISGGLSPLEFADCLLDSPDFRENLNRHEKELEKTSQQIKRIIKEIKELMQAAKSKKYVVSSSSYYLNILVHSFRNNFFRLNHVMEFFYVFFVFLFIRCI